MELSDAKVLELASKGMTNKEIAAHIGCSDDTLTRRFAATIKRGHVIRDGSLRSKLFDMAMNHNSVAAAIWLSKQHLGYTEKIEQISEFTVKDAVDHMKNLPGGRLNKYLNGTSKTNGSVPE